MQEKLGELSRTFLEMHVSEKQRKTSSDELKKKFALVVHFWCVKRNARKPRVPKDLIK